MNMNNFDKEIADRVVQQYGIGAERYLVYKIPGGTDDIAFSKSGTAFARVELSMDLSKFNNTAILSCLLTAKFEADSIRLSSIEWTTLQDHSSSTENETGKATGPSMRRTQSVFPSVVSLDHAKPSTRNVSSASISLNL
jgi:hypothetical protein